jgi:hypothetical protein
VVTIECDSLEERDAAEATARGEGQTRRFAGDRGHAMVRVTALSINRFVGGQRSESMNLIRWPEGGTSA